MKGVVDYISTLNKVSLCAPLSALHLQITGSLSGYGGTEFYVTVVDLSIVEQLLVLKLCM